MSTLHEKLLAATEQPLAGMQYSTGFLKAKVDALRAVVELHAPGEIVTIGDKGKIVATRPWCPRCRTSSPCDEVKVIARELGVEIGDQHG